MVLDLSRARKARITALAAGATVAIVTLAGCGGSGTTSAKSAPSQFTFLTNVENTTVKSALTTLSTSECSAQQKTLPLKVDTVPQTSLDQKLQLLAGQNALPVQFAAGNAPALTDQLYKSGQIAD